MRVYELKTQKQKNKKWMSQYLSMRFTTFTMLNPLVNSEKLCSTLEVI